MKVLVACEFSGVVRDAFRDLGHDAWSCDLLPTEYAGPHYQCDVLEVLDKGWDLMVAHPTCTYLTNAGVRHLHDQVKTKRVLRTGIHGSARWVELLKAAEFFNKLLHASIPRVCVENPPPHKYARALIGDYTQAIQPWQFGHGETKRTCLWLKNLPELQPTKVVEGRASRIHKMSESKDRWRERSRTYEGIARAMAEQWGVL